MQPKQKRPSVQQNKHPEVEANKGCADSIVKLLEQISMHGLH